MATEPAVGRALRTPLYDVHIRAGARMVPFAGYEMPVQYAPGVLKEHLWTRQHAGLFDVSHMGQAYLVADDGRHDTVARALESLIPADVMGLGLGQQRYSQLLNDEGGILDDLMFARSTEAEHDGWLYLVVNAACKDRDYAQIAARLPKGVRLETAYGFTSLIALQGPKAAHVLAAFEPEVAALTFMTTRRARIEGREVHVTRSGYTGEDGFEIAAHDKDASHIWQVLLDNEHVQPIGLGARDSLRLEAGLCLYGHDIDATTSPVEAALGWSIPKRRRTEGGFPGAARIQRELAEGPVRRRVGILPDGRAPAREGTEILSAAGQPVGRVTSGGFGPSVDGPVAMGYVTTAYAAPGTPVQLIVRGKPLAARVTALPFVPNRFVRKR
jgi:aminomethyltransferase